MARVDQDTRTIHFLLLYVGPAQSGKRASVQFIRERMAPTLGVAPPPGQQQQLGVTLDLGQLRGFTLRWHLITAPAAVDDASLERGLSQADAVVFVADTTRPETTRSSLRRLAPMLESASLRPPLPLVVQANRRDAPDSLDAEALRGQLGLDPSVVIVESIATRGDGVIEALKSVVKLALATHASAGSTDGATIARSRGEPGAS